LQAAREQATQNRKLQDAEAIVDGLQEKLRDAIRADETARTSQVLLHPYRKNLVFRNRLRELPPIVTPEDPEPAVVTAEKALEEAPKQIAEKVADPAARGILIGAITPVRTEVAVKGDVVGGGTVVVT